MRWQSVVRIVIAAGGIGVAALVYQQMRDRPVDTVETTAPLADPNVVSASEGGGTFEVTSADGKPTLSIAFETRREFEGGRREFTDVTSTFLRAGVRNTITAKRAVATGKAGPTGNQPAEVYFSGNVRLTTEDGLTVEADDDATFYNVDQKTVIPGRMRFTRGRLSGDGVGADLYMDKSVLWINDQAHLVIAPESEGGAPMEANAKRIGLADADHYMVLEENAVMTHQSQRLSASQLARVTFTPEQDVVSFIELRGQSAVRSVGGGTARPQLTAENINLAFAPETGLLNHARLVQGAVVELRDTGGTTRVSGSEIDLFLAPDGETLKRLEGTAPTEVRLPRQGQQPAKVITSSGLLAEGDDVRGLTRALFSGGVNYRETRPAGRGTAASIRVATADSLSLGLKGELGQVETAVFNQDFRVEDGDITATAGEGTYNSVDETLLLRSRAGAKRPQVVSPEMEVLGTEIDANLQTDSFAARGRGRERVESYLTPSAKPKTTASGAGGLFEPGKRITGSSASLTYNRSAGTAVYEGTVFLVQGESTLGADHVTVDDARNDLLAKGKVTSTLALDPAAPAKPAPNAKPEPKAGPTTVTASQLVYTDSARTAVFTGGAVLDTPTGEKVSGEQITLTLEPGDRKLKTADTIASASGEVRVTLLENRHARGNRAIYTAASDRYEVLGAPATIIVPSPERGPGECSIGTGTRIVHHRTEGTSQIETAGGALGIMRDVKCAEVIK